MNDGQVEDLITTLSLGSARGGRKPSLPLEMSVVRPLGEGDLEALQANGPAGGQLTVTDVNIKHSHHRLAQLLASGVPQCEISLLTGYSPSYISTIKNAPAVTELITYYQTQQELKFTDVLDRLKSLGLSGAEELQKRIDEEPEKWTKRELMELVELGLIGPMTASAKGPGGAGGGAGVNISVSFVKSEPKALSASVQGQGQVVIDMDDEDSDQ
jgi:hypothetical protein